MKFTKATGSGNDFIIIDNRDGQVRDPAGTARRLCPRRISVGADGLLLLENGAGGRFRMRIINADGSEAEMCGNGLRCFFLYLARRRMIEEQARVEVETGAGYLWGMVGEKSVTIGLGEPRNAETALELTLGGRRYLAGYVNTGVPHLVIEVPDLENFPVAEIGREARRHERFAPDGVNANFVRLREGQIDIRTYERGVEAETLSCGTGSAAAAYLLSLSGRLSLPATVRAASGESLEISRLGNELCLSAGARLVYEAALS